MQDRDLQTCPRFTGCFYFVEAKGKLGRLVKRRMMDVHHGQSIFLCSLLS